MSELQLPDFFFDAERYELHADPQSFELNRREFFRIAGGGLVVALLLAKESARPALAQRPRPRGGQPREIGAWLHVGENNAVTVYTGKVEIGQNIRTSLTQVVAEELHAPVE